MTREILKGQNYSSEFYGDVEIIFVSSHDEIVIQFDDGSITLLESSDEFDDSFTLIN